LQLSLGEVENAGRSSDRAAELVPELSRVQMVKGFTLLARIRINEAVQTFYAAVAQDSAAPLPRLGLGLAQIRLGSLAMGRQNIEIAAALDPDNALVRSYLGKAYYEEKRDSEAETQYALAKSLDPGDPTPFFYDAIRKQTGNRPVDALKDIQQAIKLNDNRAVYRSRFLLDQDLAARSAAQGRIYGDLGFQQLALVEGYTSVNTAPGNFSAHRFLADNYAAKPRHEIARVSELLQSQMLQPLNVTPLQPQLSVSNLGIIEGSGPSGLSFSEFNPLFTRNRLTLQANGVVGNKDTWGEEIVHAGLLNNLSYSFGQFHFETDGFRKNNHQEQNLYNGFLQLALDHRTQVQSELRIRHIDREDPEILFDPDSFSENQKEDNDSTTLRLGIHHQLSPGSDLLLSFIAEDNDIEINDRDGTVDIDIHSQFDDGKSIEGQHIFDSTTLNLVSGVGYASTPEDRDTVVDVKNPFFPVSDDVSEHFQVDSANIYTYSHWSFGDALTAIAGLSIDTVQRDWKYSDDFTTPFPPLNASTKDDDSSDRTKVNPKLGIIWNPLSSTTVRIAGFRHLSRTLVGDQTIEPTQVAGFNQFFDDFDGTDIWVAGAAIDHRFTDTLFSGIEYYHRWLDVDYEVIEGGAVRFDDDDWREQVASAYLYWAPHSMVSARLEYLFEKFDDRDDFQGVGNFIELKTHRLKMGGGLFLPCGLFARFQTTYVDQRGDFVDSDALPTGRDSDDFWVTDAALGYRLPKRYGTLSVEALNLFDESFKFQDTDPATPTIAPERWLLVKLSLNF
ncbi:MAG: TonB-dependent receptor, partial [Desulfobacterales bacterium]